MSDPIHPDNSPPPETSPEAPPPLPPGPVQTPQDPGAHAKPIGQDAGIRMLLPVGRSIWAIVAGYAGLFSILLIPAPIALLTGVAAIVDIRKSRTSPNPKHGMGRAIFGLVMGAVGTGILIAMLVALAGQA